MNRKFKAAALLSTALVVAALSGCAAPSGDADDGGDEGPIPLRVSVVASVPTFQAIAADLEGFYAEEGLDVELIRIVSSSVSVPGLGSQYDIAFATPTDVVLASEKGFDVVALAGNHYETADNQQAGLIVGKDSGIKTVEDLAGKRLALPGFSGTVYASTLLTLQNAGLTPDDVTLVEVPFPNMIDQLNGGQVDAFFALQPFLGGALAQGHYSIIDPFLQVADPALSGLWVAEREWAEKNPKAIAAFRAALDSGIEWIAGDDEAARALMTEDLGLPAEIAANISFPVWKTRIDPEALVPWIETLSKTGQLEGGAPDPNTLVASE